MEGIYTKGLAAKLFKLNNIKLKAKLFRAENDLVGFDLNTICLLFAFGECVKRKRLIDDGIKCEFRSFD